MNFKRVIVVSLLLLTSSIFAQKPDSLKLTLPEEPEQKIEGFTLTDTMQKTTTNVPAKMLPLKNQLNFYRKITADNNKLIEVFSIVGGNVIKVNVELGDYVSKGQILAAIRSTEVADFDKQLVDAKNDLLIAKNNLKVTQELFEGKLNTERDVIEAKGLVDKAASQLNRIEETYKIYNIKTGTLYEVKAPLRNRLEISYYSWKLLKL